MSRYEKTFPEDGERREKVFSLSIMERAGVR
jgi:hypothetical protein